MPTELPAIQNQKKNLLHSPDEHKQKADKETQHNEDNLYQLFFFC